jgi:hypothetical membrane protein
VTAPGGARHLAWGGVVGPLAFISCWLAGGLRTEGYSPVDDAISRLAADGAETRWLMTFGFVAFGVGVPLFGLALRRALPGSRAWIAAVVTGVATIGVALTPLDLSDGVDRLHGIAAGTGYASLALLPILAGLAMGSRCSVAVGLLIGLCLVGTFVDQVNGLAQRTGLTLGDLWILWTARAILSGTPLARPEGALWPARTEPPSPPHPNCEPQPRLEWPVLAVSSGI